MSTGWPRSTSTCLLQPRTTPRFAARHGLRHKRSQPRKKKKSFRKTDTDADTYGDTDTAKPEIDAESDRRRHRHRPDHRVHGLTSIYTYRQSLFVYATERLRTEEEATCVPRVWSRNITAGLSRLGDKLLPLAFADLETAKAVGWKSAIKCLCSNTCYKCGVSLSTISIYANCCSRRSGTDMILSMTS